MGSRGSPGCIRKQENSGFVGEEAALQAAPSAFCNSKFGFSVCGYHMLIAFLFAHAADPEGNYEDVLSKEFVVAVHCYLAGTVLILSVTVSNASQRS